MLLDCLILNDNKKVKISIPLTPSLSSPLNTIIHFHGSGWIVKKVRMCHDPWHDETDLIDKVLYTKNILQ